MRDRAVVEPDEKLGRITIPKKLLESVSAEKEMIFVGCDHKIEIWAKELYNKKQMNSEDAVVTAANMVRLQADLVEWGGLTVLLLNMDVACRELQM